MWLVLWDVDHTLMETGGVGSEVYTQAFEAVTGVRMRRHADVTGATEPELFRANLRLNGSRFDDAAELFARFAAAQAEGYRHRIDDLRRRGRELPGAKALLGALAARGDVVQTVVTGNTRASATVKLEAFELTSALDLDIGGYGSDADDRAELVHLARRRGEQAYGAEFGPGTVTLIGDTPADVAAGRASDVGVVAVATGRTPVPELIAAGADLVVPALTELSVHELLG